MSLTIFFESFKISDVFIVLSITIILYVANFYYEYFTRPNPLPGPIPLPLLGNIITSPGKLDVWFQGLHEKYGDIFEVVLLGKRRIVLCHGKYLENLLNPTKDTIYFNRVPFVKGLELLKVYGTGVAANNNFSSWRYNRTFFTQATLAPSFSIEALKRGHQLFDEMEGYWKEIGHDTPIDYSAWAHRYTNDMIISLTTGNRAYALSSYYNTISKKKSDIPLELIKDSEEFIQTVRTFVFGVAFFILTPPIVRFFLRPYQNKILKNRDYLFNKLDQIIETRRKEIEETPLDEPLRHDMLTSFITANTTRDINRPRKVLDEELLRPMTDEEIRGNMRDAIFAGTDGSANSLCFIVYYLEHYPEVKEKLRQELFKVFGNDTTRPVTQEDLDKLEYTEAVIYEVSRVRPVINMMLRHSSGPGEIAGYNWPTGTIFHMNFAAINKHKDHWDDPEKFDPERFMKKDEHRHKYAFNIFGGGLRICPGRKLAMIELKLLTALVYRKYDLELIDMDAPLNIRSTVISLCQELMVKVKPRNLIK